MERRIADRKQHQQHQWALYQPRGKRVFLHRSGRPHDSDAGGPCGGWNSAATLTAHLSDGSAADLVDVTSGSSGQYNRNYTITYRALSSAQTLTVTWTMSSGIGNVTLNGAALATPAGGLLSGTVDSSTAGANLTTEGGTDWVHWGTTLNRKAGVTAQLSNYTVVGGGSAGSYGNDLRPLSWSDGTPTASSANNTSGLYISPAGRGFSSPPGRPRDSDAGGPCGRMNSAGTLTAHLSDGSAADMVDVTSGSSGQYDRNYTITYRALSSAQTLTVTWAMTSGIGNVTLNGAALSHTMTATDADNIPTAQDHKRTISLMDPWRELPVFNASRRSPLLQ